MGDEQEEGFVSWRWLAAIAVTVVMAGVGNWAIGISNDVAAQNIRQAAIEREHGVIVTSIAGLKDQLDEIKVTMKLVETDMRHVRDKLDRRNY